MKIYGSIIIQLWLDIWSVCGIPPLRKSETTQNFYKGTGDAIADNNLIWEYEREHQKLYNEGTRDGTLLCWPDLVKKNLSNYCRKYLQHSVSMRMTDDPTGTKIERELHYVNENSSITNKIVIVQCKIFLNYCKPRSYYITRALQPNCIYALNRATDGELQYKYTIINRYCNFDEKLLRKRCLKRKIVDVHRTIDPNTGQPIAKDEYLLEYELEHLNMIMKGGKEGNCFEWPKAVTHENLDIYCYQYMQECCPHRNRVDVTGSWQSEKLHYQKINRNSDVRVITVSCATTGRTRVYYQMTRAPETNCVYSLLRKSGGVYVSLVIAFKHCDFEKPNDHQTTLNDKEVPDIKTEKELYHRFTSIEDKQLTSWSIKKKNIEIINKLHRQSGQPIAKDKYLLEHELEHQEYFKRKGVEDKCIEWPQAMTHGNLDFYCYQYMRAAVPNRNRDGVTGSWKFHKLHYQKISTIYDTEVAIVICKNHILCRSHYYMTRAPEPNCVYALLRNGRSMHAPFMIIFKHCNFDYQNYQQVVFYNYDILNKNVFPNETKKEGFNTQEALQLFTRE